MTNNLHTRINTALELHKGEQITLDSLCLTVYGRTVPWKLKNQVLEYLGEDFFETVAA